MLSCGRKVSTASSSFGIATSEVVLSTLRYAADQDPEVHRVLLEKVFPHQATVINVADWHPNEKNNMNKKTGLSRGNFSNQVYI
jgi:nicotinamidase-related amidase